MTFAKGGLILGPTVNARFRSWECAIDRDGACLRGEDPGHDPDNADDHGPRFWRCARRTRTVTVLP